MTFKPRAWQAAMLDAFRQKILKAKDNRAAGNGFASFTADIVPGGGKTDGGIMCTLDLRREGLCDFVVVVSPGIAVARGWAAKGLKNHGLHMHYGLMFPSWADTPDGASITIQSLITDPSNWIGHIQKREASRIGLIVDEIHHYSSILSPEGGEEARRWAETLSDLVQAIRPAWQLNLSGTVFRSRSNERIVGVEYVNANDTTGDLIASTDYTYSIAQGIRDRVVRPVRFVFTDGQVTWRETDSVISANFGDVLTKKGSSRRLRTALQKLDQGSVMRHLLELGHEELLRCRAGSTPRAAGQVIAMNIDHAREVARVLKEVTGNAPVVITSDDKGNSQDLIDQFRESDELWLVSVDMVSEGVDIPRLLVQVYGTNKLALLYMIQAMARVQRYQDPERDETAVILCPNDSRLVDAAKLHEEANRAALQLPDPATPRTPPEVPGGTPPPLDPWVPIGSKAEGLATVFRGEFLDPDVVAYYTKAAADLGKDPAEVALAMIKNLSPEELAQIKQKGAKAATASPDVDRVKQRQHLRVELSKEVRKLAYKRLCRSSNRTVNIGNGDGPAFQAEVTNVWVEIGTPAQGGVEEMSIPSLERALDRVRTLLLSVDQPAPFRGAF